MLILDCLSEFQVYKYYLRTALLTTSVMNNSFNVYYKNREDESESNELPAVKKVNK